MRITLVHSHFAQMGGAERYALDLAGAYAGAGHTVTILSTTPPPSGPWTAELLPAPRPAWLWLHRSRVGKVFRHLADLWPRRSVSAQITATRPDVVHLHNWQRIGAGTIGRVARNVPVVHTVHDFALTDPTTTLDRAHWSQLKVAVLRVRSGILSAQLRDVWLHWPAERTQQLAAAFEPSLLRDRAAIIPLSARSTDHVSELPSLDDLRSDGEPAFLFLGNLSQHKGLGDVLNSWPERLPAAKSARLLIAGDGPLRASVEAAARSDPSITYLGYVDAEHGQAALQRARWVLFPSRWHENFSMTCVEALAAATPILCSGIARPPMASAASLVVAPEPADLAGALAFCAGMSPEDYLTYAQNARRDGQSLLWSSHVQSMLDLLDRLVCETSIRVPASQKSRSSRSTRSSRSVRHVQRG